MIRVKTKGEGRPRKHGGVLTEGLDVNARSRAGARLAAQYCSEGPTPRQRPAVSHPLPTKSAVTSLRVRYFCVYKLVVVCKKILCPHIIKISFVSCVLGIFTNV